MCKSQKNKKEKKNQLSDTASLNLLDGTSTAGVETMAASLCASVPMIKSTNQKSEHKIPIFEG